MRNRTISGPPDGGWGWMCVAGKLYCCLCILGSPAAFGIIYIELIDYFNTTREVAAWIGSLSFGLTFLTGPLSSALISRFGIQKTSAAGILIAFLGCFISWFANGIPYLYFSYGVLTGIGFGIAFVPCMLIVVQYFDKRLGLANAIGATGEGIGGLIFPPLYTFLLEEYGWRGTLLLLSGFILNCFVCAVVFMPPEFLKGWLFDMTKTYDLSFHVVGGVFFLSGAINMVVMVLHRHQNTEETVLEVTVPTVSQSHINRNQENQNFSSLEQIYM